MRFCDDRGDDGFSWTVSEPMTRTSHALSANGHVWLVDALDWPEAIDRARSLGSLAGVVQLLDRHTRDCAALAQRHGVPHLVAPATLPGTPFEAIRIAGRLRWHEVALWWPERRTLVTADALGTNRFFPTAGDRVGVHPFLKPFPPHQLLRTEPEHLLVGHGEGLHGPEAAKALRQALGRSRLSFFRWAAGLPFRVRELKRAG